MVAMKVKQGQIELVVFKRYLCKYVRFSWCMAAEGSWGGRSVVHKLVNDVMNGKKNLPAYGGPSSPGRFSRPEKAYTSRAPPSLRAAIVGYASARPSLLEITPAAFRSRTHRSGVIMSKMAQYTAGVTVSELLPK